MQIQSGRTVPLIVDFEWFVELLKKHAGNIIFLTFQVHDRDSFCEAIRLALESLRISLLFLILTFSYIYRVIYF